MAYQANIPQATSALSQSQADILNNFTAIGTMMDPNANTLTLPVAGGNPVAPVGNYGFIFSKLVGSDVNLFWMPKTTGTAVNLSDGMTALKNANGWTKLPSGIVLAWGAATTSSSTYTVTATGITTIYSAQVSGAVSGDQNKTVHLNANTFSGNTFTVTSQQYYGGHTEPAVDFTWFAVGV